MTFLKSLFDNVFSKNIMGFSGEMAPNEKREPIYPGWFYTAPFGQPRNLNVLEVRNFAKSPWVQMVKNTIKKEMSTIKWDIVNVDDKDETDYKADIQKVKDFLNNVNENDEDIYDVIVPMMEDLLTIDAGAWVKVFSLDSYTLGEVPVYNGYGTEIGTQPGMVLKPLGQRTLNQIKIADGSTLLRQVDLYRRDLAWYQYSFKNPRTNPKKFYPEEVVYFMMNINPDSVYGFSPPQSIQQILELLIQATRWNKDYFKNNAIPDGIIGLPNANKDSMEQFKSMWNNEFKGKAHKLLFHNTAAQFAQFMTNARDMEWLEGQKWYFHLVFAVFGMSPTEVGFHENVNQGNQAGQERVTVKNAIKPYLAKVEKRLNRCILTEILQQDKPKIKFTYKPKDHAEEQIEFDQSMKEIELGALTINEYRRGKGREKVEWGDKPSKPQTNNDERYQEDQAERETEAQKPTKPEQKIKKEIDIDVVDEAEDYEDFFIKIVDEWEKRVLMALGNIDIGKAALYHDRNEFIKTFGEFVQGLFNGVTTRRFLVNLRKIIKKSMVEGMEVAEEEVGVNIGWNGVFQNKLKGFEYQQLNGYMINGKKWHGIKGASQDLRLKILKSVQEDVVNKVSKSDMADNIKKIFSGATTSQAKAIARTETTRFVNETKLTSYVESKIKGLKGWDAVMDTNTADLDRRLHNKYNKKGIPFDEEFVDDVTGLRFMNPPTRTNCRCVIFYQPLIKDEK